MKKPPSAGVHPLGRVDLAGAQTLEQRLRREVDQDHLVGGPQNRVGKGLPHPDPGQLGDLVVERLQVLDVDGGEDVDSRFEHVLDVLVALLVLHPGGVGMGQLVDQRQVRRPADHRIGIHLPQDRVPVGNPRLGNRLETLGESHRLAAVVRFQVADHDVLPGFRLGVPLLKHPIGLSHPSGHPEEDLVVALPLSVGGSSVL